MPMYQSVLQLKTKGSNGEDRSKITIFRAENDQEAIEKTNKKARKIGETKFDLKVSYIKRGRIYKKIKIVREITFKSIKIIFLSGVSVPTN